VFGSIKLEALLSHATEGLFIWSQAGPVNREDSFNKTLITALINIQNDISKLN
jgi:hypothetical protein